MMRVNFSMFLLLIFFFVNVTSLKSEEKHTYNFVNLTIMNDTLYAIDLDNNGYDFPTYIYKFDSCKILRMDNCYYDEIPNSISLMKGLEEINITKCFNLNYSKTFQNLSNNHITKLSLINDSLNEVPLEIKYLPKLKDLYLSNNQISIIPKEVFNLENLQSIRINENNISTFDLDKNILNITSLYLSNCDLIELPSGIKHLCNLKFLGLPGNKNLDLEDICEVVKNFENLETIIITGCKKNKIPPNIENLKIVKKKVIAQFMFTDEELILLRSKGIKI